MITLPNYDNQSFENIMEMARRRIPVIYPEWTDMNEHDPGITVLELFAWLKEMQQYHLNRITEQGYESMLALLGTSVGEPQASRTYIALQGISSKGRLPQGMRFETQGGITFECENTVELKGLDIKSIYVNDGADFTDVMDIILEPGIYCHPFGQKPVEGESALYIGLDQLKADFEFRLFLQFDDSFPVERNPFDEESKIPREILWEYGVEGENGLEFKQLEVLQDKTYGFSQSGEVLFKTDKEAMNSSLDGKIPEGCWLRARLIKKGCEENPRLINIFKDIALAEQKKTLCETLSYTINEKSGDYKLELGTWLASKGEHMVFVRDTYGWNIHNDFTIKNSIDDNVETAQLELVNLPGNLAVDGNENIRVLCYEAGFGGSMVLEGSNGLPCQRFYFKCEDYILREKLSIMVYEETEEGHRRWTDWHFVPKLFKAGPYDCCFTYDKTESEIVFGDNEQGAIPMAGDSNIIITGCVTTKGAMGNILRQSFVPVKFGSIAAVPGNPVSAQGGKDSENILLAIDRVKAEIKKCVKAVTATDYEELAAATPGLRVMGVRAIPFYDPDSKVAGDKQAPATVTVVVMPYNEGTFPKPDEQFLEAVRRHLERFRLITTRVKVIGPQYIKISVNIEVLVSDINKFYIEENIKAAVEAYFYTVQRGAPGGKPEFGEPVRESVITMQVSAVPGVENVNKISLGARNTDSYKDKYGNIIIPLHGLPYLGDLQIRTLLK